MVRVKRRYVLLKTVRDRSQVKFTDADFRNEVRTHVASSYGDFGVGCLNRGFVIKKHDPNEGYLIIQLRKGVHEMVMSVLPLVTQINNIQCGFNVLHLSGTLRGSFKKLQLHYIRSVRASIGQELARKAGENTKEQDKLTQEL